MVLDGVEVESLGIKMGLLYGIPASVSLSLSTGTSCFTMSKSVDAAAAA
jgi:hypothetical protein